MSAWIAPSFEQIKDGIRAEDCTQPHRIGFEDHISGEIRDLNEELQTNRELPKETIAERLACDRAIFKIYGDFVSTAVEVCFFKQKQICSLNLIALCLHIIIFFSFLVLISDFLTLLR